MKKIPMELLETCQEAYKILAIDIGYEGEFMDRLAKMVSKAGGRLEAQFIQDAVEVRCPFCLCGTIIEKEFIKVGYSDHDCKTCGAPITYNSLKKGV